MSRSTTDRIASLVVVLILGSCRFGGPTGDPTLLVEDAGGLAGSGGQGGQAGSAGSDGQGGAGASGGTSGGAAGTNPGGAAGATADASGDIARDAVTDARDADTAGGLDVGADAASDGQPGDSEPPTTCLPPFSSAVCDPVCNTGCPALFRCDITDTPRTGICVGTLLSTATEGMACSRSVATDDCVERLSCVESTCKRFCYRDTDCTTSGTCCSGAVDIDGGASGYRVCAPCAP